MQREFQQTIIQDTRAYHSHRVKTKRIELEENHGSTCMFRGRKRASRDMPHLRRSTPVGAGRAQHEVANRLAAFNRIFV